MRARVFSAAVAASVLASTGCLLWTNDPDDYGTTCHFTGEDTECGQCIRASCQSQVNECCGNSDYSCGDTVMKSLDQCAPTNSCVRSAGTSSSSSSGSSSVDARLSTCLSASCAGACGQ